MQNLDEMPSPRLRIHWVVSGISGTRETGLHSSLASNRYRTLFPVQGIERYGHEVQIIDAADWVKKEFEAPGIVVIGKLLPGRDTAAWQLLANAVLEQINACVSNGIPVVADFNDDHFGHALLGSFWRQLAGLSTLCTAGSEAMAQTVRQHAAGRVVVVGDPLGSPAGRPRVYHQPRMLEKLLPFKRRSRLQMVWFGNPQNWEPMAAWLLKIEALAHDHQFLLWVVTTPNAKIEADVAHFNAKVAPSAFAEIVPWSEEIQWQIVSESHVVLIPSDPGANNKAVKTSNRLADAVHAGRYVVASPLPAYQAYADAVTLTDDPLSSLRSYLKNPEAWLPRIAAGQQLCLQLCGLDAIITQWIAAFNAAIAEPRRLATAAPPIRQQAPMIRLNLGCGDKILAGYVNVDVVASRKGAQPDVICDLHKLSMFQDNEADEVMAIHVVEHFWRWEIEDILREWIRVLKPGGQMILECPNLLSACEDLLRNPVAGARPSAEGQRTMWVFYGDPSWKDPYMIHRWGYTPESLTALMETVGLQHVRQEPAQFKLREPRDMRIVGYKP